MASINDTITKITSARSQYDKAAQELSAAVQEAEDTAQALDQVGAEALSVVVAGVKSSLQGHVTSTGSVTSALDQAVTTLQAAAKG